MGQQFVIDWTAKVCYVLMVVIVIIASITYMTLKLKALEWFVYVWPLVFLYLLFCIYLMIDMVLQMEIWPSLNSACGQYCIGRYLFNQHDQLFLLPNDDNLDVSVSN